jgi:hypothetical protein
VTDAEISRHVKTIRFSPPAAREGGRLPTLSALARQTGLSRKQLYRIAEGQPLGQRSRQALAEALNRV